MFMTVPVQWLPAAVHLLLKHRAAVVAVQECTQLELCMWVAHADYRMLSNNHQE